MKLTKKEQKIWDGFYNNACNNIVYGLIIDDWLYLWTDANGIAIRLESLE